MGSISDLDEVHVVSLLARDIEATTGPGYFNLVQAVARHQRQFGMDRESYTAQVVEDVQQYFHDLSIDTTWPACPLHPNHPMWFENGWWVADGQPLVALGGLGNLLR